MKNNYPEEYPRQKTNQTARHDLLSRIETGDLSMRSKNRFLLQLGMLVVLAVLVITLSAAIFSFILYSIRQSGSGALVGFNNRELLLFLHLFPWAFLLIDIAAVILFELLLRQFAFGYRRSMFSLLLIALVSTVLLGVALDQSRANDLILERARNEGVPFFDTVYDGERLPPARELGVCRCVIEGMSGNILLMREDSPLGSTTVMGLLPPGFATSSLVIGQPVFIIGDFASDTIRVVDVQKI